MTINPFVTNGYAGPQYFCDRVEETDFLTRMLTNGNNVALYQVTETGSTCSIDMIDTAVNYILDLSSDTYQAILYQMPEKQRNVLMAIAREKMAISISSGAFAKRNHLPSPSAVVSAVRGLLEKDFITQEANAYMIYDRFFQLWLEREVV